MRFQGWAYRAHNPRWSFKPSSGAGAALHGGRFNPRGVPALYLSAEPMTAVKEANQGFSRKIEPLVLCSYELDCADIVDLTKPEEMANNGIGENELACPWFSLALAGQTPPSWRVAQDLIRQGAAGIRVRSFVRGARGDERNIVLWRWGEDAPHRVRVFDPSGRLPKDQLSWR